MAVQVRHGDRSLIVTLGPDVEPSMFEALAEALESLPEDGSPLVVDFTDMEDRTSIGGYLRRLSRLARTRPAGPCAAVLSDTWAHRCTHLGRLRIYNDLTTAIAVSDQPDSSAAVPALAAASSITPPPCPAASSAGLVGSTRP